MHVDTIAVTCEFWIQGADLAWLETIEGSKHVNTHISTAKLFFHGPDGIRPFLFGNIPLRQYKILVVPIATKVEKTLHEWHFKLRYLNKEIVIDMLSKKLVVGLPTFLVSELRKCRSIEWRVAQSALYSLRATGLPWLPEELNEQ
ncbi:Chemotaxis protein CheY [Phytophthora palmivora]|uniref:Chemotaxis protein CheY n=1 Tax=Phytophthora palmivora TaxID=4796 RepID=A0A2P4Y9F3_9STRA|nr:Chemotaxis protein CheY [Phytophthora palmivora]